MPCGDGTDALCGYCGRPVLNNTACAYGKAGVYHLECTRGPEPVEQWNQYRIQYAHVHEFWELRRRIEALEQRVAGLETFTRPLPPPPVTSPSEP